MTHLTLFNSIFKITKWSQFIIYPYHFPLYLINRIIQIMQKTKSVEEIYQKKTPLQHILLRPDTYIGTVEASKEQKWVLNQQKRFTYKQITYTPGFYKIFDQVLVNAADNYQRDRKMNTLKVDINQQQGYVSVHNNGKGIPVVIHKQHKIFVPQLIFGHLLTGSNYNDDEKRIVGGRNGYGAKLANVFSKKFIVECGDGSNNKRFKMTWTKNMEQHGQAEISPYSGKDYVIVTFYPDFKRFNMMNGLDADILSLMRKRVYDMAGILPRVRVSLNNDQIDIKAFSQYVDLYFDRDANPTKIFDKEVNSERWQVIISISQGQFRQVSFVNGVCTSKGGTHVNYIVDQIADKVKQKIQKKQKNLQIKPFQIKAHIWVFINCLIQNPTFDTQTKQTLTLKAANFGSKCQLNDKMIKSFLNLGIVDTVISLAKAKQLSKLAKATAGQKKSKITGIPKLQDANEAGGKDSEKCTLILTQGDSAKTLAVAGLSTIGRDYYGVFPLKGKLLNVRDANLKQLGANEQIQNLLKIIGLQIGKKYEDLKSLRYGSIMIMSDQDTDGSHIKGLVINFISNFWPDLFKMDGFVKQFITPLLKVSKGTTVVSFYTMNNFKEWSQTIPDLKKWKIKYYKGLGTSTDAQAKQYFSDLRKHKIDFQYVNDQDDQAIDLIFNKKKAEERKRWLANYDPKVTIQYDRPKIRYKQFVDHEFIHFSNQDNHRSIASLLDGFKPGQRKILFGCFKKNMKQQIKVAQLAGYIAENSAYHHGEQSLVETIVGMAQNYVGSNNINLLMPNGQFGSRNQGGKDHASARYIFTQMSRVTRFLFPEPDDHILTYVEDDGQIVQPEYYMPIIPMVLVNGCQGIGTGWSTSIPNFNPRDLCEAIKRRLQGNQFQIIHPWYKNYTGSIIPNGDFTSYQMTGRFQKNTKRQNTLDILQLPVGKWTKDYKAWIDQVMSKGDTQIQSFKQYHTKDTVHFEIELNEDKFKTLYDDPNDPFKVIKFFKLQGSISMKNLVGFNAQGKLVKMEGVKDILQMFFQIRMQNYHKRKAYLESRLLRQLTELSQKERFIIQVVQQKIKIRNVRKDKIIQVLKQKKFLKKSQLPKILSTKKQQKKPKQSNEQKEQKDQKEQQQNEQQDQKQQKSKSDVDEYNYLLGMSLWNLSYQKVQEIKAKRLKAKQQLEILQNTKVQTMWENDIDAFLNELNKIEDQQAKERNKQFDAVKKLIGKAKPQKAKKKNVVKKQKRGKWSDDDQSETLSQSSFEQKMKPVKRKQNKPKVESSQGSMQSFPKQKKQTKKAPKQPPKKKPKIQQSDEEDFFARISNKIKEGNKPEQNKPNKQIKLEEMFTGGKMKEREEKYNNIEPLPKKNGGKKKSKRKMALDSDDEDDDAWSDDQDEDDEDNFLNY